MEANEIKAVDAIWKTNLNNGNEKLVLYQLTSRHELGNRFSSSWKTLDEFIKDFELKWTTIKEIMEGTQLSQVKVQRTLDTLTSQKFVESSEVPIKLKKKQIETGEMQAVYAITDKIFVDFVQNAKNNAKGA